MYLSNIEQKVSDAKIGMQLLLGSRRAIQELIDKFGRDEAKAIMTIIDRCLPHFKNGVRAWELLAVDHNEIHERYTRYSITALWSRIPDIMNLFGSMRGASLKLNLSHGEWLRCNYPEHFNCSQTWKAWVQEGYYGPHSETREPFEGPVPHIDSDFLQHKLASIMTWPDSDTTDRIGKTTGGGFCYEYFTEFVIETKTISGTQHLEKMKSRLFPQLEEVQLKGNGERMSRYSPVSSERRVFDVYRFGFWAPASASHKIRQIASADPDCEGVFPNHRIEDCRPSL